MSYPHSTALTGMPSSKSTRQPQSSNCQYNSAIALSRIGSIIYLNRINHSISLDEFKNIFYMEWGHRVLGRVIGVAFVLPLSYFAIRKKLTASMPAKLTGMALLLGFQGVLGWYMVKSGLEDSIMETPGAVPRVSQYRLAAHLGTAVLLYAGMLGTGLAAIKDWRYARGGAWSGSNTTSWQEVLSNPAVKRFTRYSRALTALVFLTALSGR